jgi:hypothetical protein
MTNLEKLKKLELKLDDAYDALEEAEDEVRDAQRKIEAIESEIEKFKKAEFESEAAYIPPRALGYSGPAGFLGYLVDGYQIEISWPGIDYEYESSESAFVVAYDPRATLVLHETIGPHPSLPDVLHDIYTRLGLEWPPAKEAAQSPSGAGDLLTGLQDRQEKNAFPEGF